MTNNPNLRKANCCFNCKHADISYGDMFGCKLNPDDIDANIKLNMDSICDNWKK